MLLAYRLVRLIETHSEQLAAALHDKLLRSQQCHDFSHVPPEEFRQRVSEIYHNLGEWLLGKTESEVERRYREIGHRRAQQGVPLSQVIWALALTKENLMEFLGRETIEDQPAELFGELEILQLLEQFFDRATYYAALGYEHAAVAKAAVSRK
jgi:hypothetical protein